MLMPSSEMLTTARNIQSAKRKECTWNICMDYTSLALFLSVMAEKLIDFSTVSSSKCDLGKAGKECLLFLFIL
jgi:hypothetical protein